MAVLNYGLGDPPEVPEGRFVYFKHKPLQYGCLWTPLDPTRPLVPVPRYYGTFRYFQGTFRYVNLILKGMEGTLGAGARRGGRVSYVK